MAENALMLWGADIDLASLVASSTASGLPVTNLQIADPNRKWRSTSAFSQYITVDFGASGAVAANAIGLIGTNFTGAGTFRIRASNTSLAATVSAPSFDSGSGYQSVWVGGTRPAVTAWAQFVNFYKWTNTTAYRYWRVDFIDGSLSYIEIGRLFLGKYTQPTLNIGPSSPTIGFVSADKVELTDFGQTITDRRGYARRTMSVTFEAQDQAEAQVGAFEFARRLGNGGDFLFCVDPSDTSYFHQWSMQCVFTNTQFQAVALFSNNKPCWGVTLQLVELVY